MARTFQPVIKKARFVVTGYSAQQMLRIGDALNSSIAARMDRAMDVYDQPAPPLNQNYARYKQRRFGSSIRDLKATGRMRRSMRPLSAAPNRVTLGFTDDVANQRAAFNNRRIRQYGVSPSDQVAIHAALNAESSPVRAQQVA